MMAIGHSLFRRLSPPIALLIAAAPLSADTGPFVIPIDPSSSSVTAEVCIPGGCDTDTSGVRGMLVVSLDDGDSPSSITLHDFALELTEPLDLQIDVFLGQLLATGNGIALSYAFPGTAIGPEALAGDSFLFAGVPTDPSGIVSYTASGTVCVALGASGLPCSDVRDLSTQGTASGDLAGTIEVVDGVAMLALQPDVTVPLDPTNPELGTLTVSGTVNGMAGVPLPAPVPAVSTWGLAWLLGGWLCVATMVLRRTPRAA